MAHKKGQGSSSNGRDSNPKMLGVKLYGGQVAKPGAIIVRQLGTKLLPVQKVGLGKDSNIFSLIDGTVAFERVGKNRKRISVYAAEN